MEEGLKIELGKQGVFVTTIEELYNWGRRSSIWPMQFGLACCAIEMIATTMARYRSEEHTSELQSLRHLVCRLLLEKKKKMSCNQHHDVQTNIMNQQLNTLTTH